MTAEGRPRQLRTLNVPAETDMLYPQWEYLHSWAVRLNGNMHQRSESTSAAAPTRRPGAPRLPASLCLLLMAMWAGEARGADAVPEYAVKAALMVKFAQNYLKWPSSAFPAANSPLSIGVLGDDPFGGTLDQLAQGVEIGSEKRRIVIKRSQKVDDLKTCQMVFVCKSENDHVPQILDALEGSALTVGETDGFTAHGGIINFYIANEKVRFEINNDAAVHRGITISPDLIAISKPQH
jgi:hypothetical protein